MTEKELFQYHMDLNDEDKNSWLVRGRNEGGRTILIGYCHGQTVSDMEEALAAIGKVFDDVEELSLYYEHQVTETMIDAVVKGVERIHGDDLSRRSFLSFIKGEELKLWTKL